ncbi:MAG TPA: V-type ATPase 116kDa subunit family protein [Anaerolineales bacterium]|nr:V-type ATPase 116kDa subunit family protein [Anaerolineales bacterium]
MFFPREMTEVELIIPSKDLVPVTRVLSGRGVFHQVDSTYLGLESLGPSTWQEKAANYSTLERRIQTIMQTLILEEEPRDSSDFDTIVELDAVRPAVDRIEAEVKGTNDQLSSERKRLEILESQLRQLEPISHVNFEVGSLRNSSYLHSILGVMPAAQVTRLESSLSRVPHVFFTLKEDTQKPVVWLLGPRSNSDILDRAAKSAYLNPLTLPEEFSGTPERISAMTRKAIDESRQKIFELESGLKKLAGTHKKELQKLWWDVHVSRLMADAIVRFGQLRHTYVVVGWVPTSDLQLLTERLKQASKEILIETIPTDRSGHHSHVPVALTKNKWLRPIQDLVTTYGRPSYGELDPTILIAFTFPFLYGAMFGDLGQGLVLMLVGFLAHNRIFMKGLQSLGLLLVYCGFSATVFGFLYGSIFGFEGHLIEEYLHFHFEPTWLSPIEGENILTVLRVAIDAGIIILLFGYLLGLFNNIRSRDWAHFWFGHTGVVALIFYVSFLALLGGFLADTAIAPKVAVAISNLPLPFTTIALVFGAGIMFSGFFRNLVEGHRPLIEGKGLGGILMFGVQSFMDIFETVISMLSNTLSFVRVGAFAVAHGGLSLAIFSLAGEEPDLGFWITILIGNIFIIGFEGLIVYIQTMRLHYYEILGKFFHGGGMRFEPLRLNPSQEEA